MQRKRNFKRKKLNLHKWGGLSIRGTQSPRRYILLKHDFFSVIGWTEKGV